MSFSYKTLNSTDITLTSYIANKQWEVNNSALSSKGITVYIGENLPVNSTNPFKPTSDVQTSNEEYRRLIFQSIKHLYYQNYISGSSNGQFFNSSSYFNYEQSTLVSGTIRDLTTITGSNLNPSYPVLYDNPTSQSLYDAASSLYDLDGLDPDAGSRIAVISIDKNIFGSGLSPNSVYISGSTYNIQDDGEGNMIDTLTSTYIGNIFYSHGLIVITNQNYLCIFGVPPTTVDNTYSYDSSSPSSTLDVLANDFTDCGILNYDSFLASTYQGYNFPNYTQSGGIITITPDQSSVIPGNYKLNYTVANNSGIRSNTSSISLTITSQSLNISNITSSSICFGSASLRPVTYSINYGVPYYSYSFDGVNYTSSNSLTTITVSGSLIASNNNIIYAKDYFGTITTASFSSWYSPITYTYSIINPRCYNNPTAGGTIEVLKIGTAISASIGTGSYFALPSFVDIPTTSSLINFKDINGCVTSSTFLLPLIPILTASVTTTSVSCFGGFDGIISASFTNVSPYNIHALILQTGSIYLTASNGYTLDGNYGITDFPNNSFTVNNLPLGVYTMSLDPGEPDFPYITCQYYGPSYITITQQSQLTLSTTSSYQSTCSNAISYSIAGGTSPYTFRAIDTGSLATYSTDTSPLILPNLSGSTYSFIVTDTNGCTITGSLLTVYGRTYIYSGSNCLTI